MQPKRHSLEFLREQAHLRFRTNTFGAVFRIRHAVAFAIHQFFNERGFYYLHTPIITGSDAEGAGEMFQVTALPIDGSAPRTEEGNINYKEENVVWVDENFFTFFDIKLLKGDPVTCLNRPDALVISESAAEKYFKNEGPKRPKKPKMN